MARDTIRSDTSQCDETRLATLLSRMLTTCYELSIGQDTLLDFQIRHMRSDAGYFGHNWYEIRLLAHVDAMQLSGLFAQYAEVCRGVHNFLICSNTYIVGT